MTLSWMVLHVGHIGQHFHVLWGHNYCQINLLTQEVSMDFTFVLPYLQNPKCKGAILLYISLQRGPVMKGWICCNSLCVRYVMFIVTYFMCQFSYCDTGKCILSTKNREIAMPNIGIILQWIFLAATKQLYEWYLLSVCVSVRLSHLFDYVHIIVSSWNFQELSPRTRVRSMQKIKVGGQRSRSQRSQPNLTISGL